MSCRYFKRLMFAVAFMPIEICIFVPGMNSRCEKVRISVMVKYINHMCESNVACFPAVKYKTIKI